MEKNNYNITPESFEFVQLNSNIHDVKLDSKPVSYLKDAMRRFAKNKGSVVAACIILLLILMAIFAPIISPYKLTDRDRVYSNKPPMIASLANSGFWDGCYNIKSQNETDYIKYNAIYTETGYNPIAKVNKTYVSQTVNGEVTLRDLHLNTYYSEGVEFQTITLDEYNAIQKYQNENNVQILVPYVMPGDLVPNSQGTFADSQTLWNGDGGANYWYKVDKNGKPILKNGQLIPAYKKTPNPDLYTKGSQAWLNAYLESTQFPEYNSKRIASDPYDSTKKNTGYVYGTYKGDSVHVRVIYYNYYIYKVGHEPQFWFGTEQYGRCIMEVVGRGARFSLLLALCVSVINLTLGALYGAIEGYYGGAIDMTMERISDILSGVPLMIVVTLFNLHLAGKTGVVPAFILAFVATGWIGMASLVRKQFYRFKGQEYILAARTLGASDWRLMFKHIFPNSLGTIITSCVLVIPGVIGSETMLTYLNIVNLESSNTASIGALMQQGQACMTTTPHVIVFPAIFISLLMICFNLFGNGLRDAFNPSLRGSED